MTQEITVPFSARNRGATAQIDNDFPVSARTGLFHLLSKLVELEYIAGWKPVIAELQRIGRVIPTNDRETNVFLLINDLSWDRVFNFCERLYSQLAMDVARYDHQTEEWDIATPKSEVQAYITSELQLLFLEENLAFEFSNGMVRRRGRRNTAEKISNAERVLSDPRLAQARGHINKALRYFRDVSKPDYENVVKEAVCAVEATARALFPSTGTTLGDIATSLSGSGEIPSALVKTFHGLYGFRNGGEGVAHGGATGGAVTKEIAEYCLAVASSQIVFLFDLSSAEPEFPF